MITIKQMEQISKKKSSIKKRGGQVASPRSIKIKQGKFLVVYEKSMGNISVACGKSNVSRSTFYRWVEASQDFKNQIEAINESNIDYVESKLFSSIGDKNIAAIIFFLKTKGKHRGYVERVEQELTLNPFTELMQTTTSEEDM